MARVGRKPQGRKHVDKLEASELAKRRLKAILATLAGEQTVPEACAELGVNEARFHKLREQWLQKAVGALEPGRPGRPAKVVSPAAARIAELEAQVRALQIDVETARVRAELAQILPHVHREAPSAADDPEREAAPAAACGRGGERTSARARKKKKRAGLPTGAAPAGVERARA